MDEALDEGGRVVVGMLKYFSLSFFSTLWSIWNYRNKATVKKEPFFATNVVMYCKILISMCRVTNSSKNKERL